MTLEAKIKYFLDLALPVADGRLTFAVTGPEAARVRDAKSGFRTNPFQHAFVLCFHGLRSALV
jgi:hypothetical protein